MPLSTSKHYFVAKSDVYLKSASSKGKKKKSPAAGRLVNGGRYRD